jgi:hypothetical protein
MIIINQTKFQASMNCWKELRDIPNTKNFQCVVLRDDGFQILATVKKTDAGQFTLNTNKLFPYSRLVSWRNLTGQDREALKNIK